VVEKCGGVWNVAKHFYLPLDFITNRIEGITPISIIDTYAIEHLRYRTDENNGIEPLYLRQRYPIVNVISRNTIHDFNVVCHRHRISLWATPEIGETFQVVGESLSEITESMQLALIEEPWKRFAFTGNQNPWTTELFATRLPDATLQSLTT
jgi:hypothetical protein